MSLPRTSSQPHVCTHAPRLWSVHLLRLVVLCLFLSVGLWRVRPSCQIIPDFGEAETADRRTDSSSGSRVSVLLPATELHSRRPVRIRTHTHVFITSWSTVWINMIPVESSDGLRHLLSICKSTYSRMFFKYDDTTDFWFYLTFLDSINVQRFWLFGFGSKESLDKSEGPSDDKTTE